MKRHPFAIGHCAMTQKIQRNTRPIGEHHRNNINSYLNRACIFVFNMDFGKVEIKDLASIDFSLPVDGFYTKQVFGKVEVK